jgi:putative ATP-grasp target RiPP
MATLGDNQRQHRMVAVGGGPATFADDPLVSVSGQFSLGCLDTAPPHASEAPSGPATRPFGLRWVRDVGLPTVPSFFRYCPQQQTAVDVARGEPIPPNMALEWTTQSHLDGDEGPSKDYGWETVPDFLP